MSTNITSVYLIFVLFNEICYSKYTHTRDSTSSTVNWNWIFHDKCSCSCSRDQNMTNALKEFDTNIVKNKKTAFFSLQKATFDRIRFPTGWRDDWHSRSKATSQLSSSLALDYTQRSFPIDGAGVWCDNKLWLYMTAQTNRKTNQKIQFL